MESPRKRVPIRATRNSVLLWAKTLQCSKFRKQAVAWLDEQPDEQPDKLR